jgi:hypothetical protein
MRMGVNQPDLRHWLRASLYSVFVKRIIDGRRIIPTLSEEANATISISTLTFDVRLAPVEV